MLQKESYIDVAEKSGAKFVKCIGMLKGAKENRARIGDIIVVFVQDALPNSKVSGGDVVRAVIVGSKVGVRRKDGTFFKI